MLPLKTNFETAVGAPKWQLRRKIYVIPSVASMVVPLRRLAFAWALGRGVDVDSLLRKAGLSRIQIEDPHVRIGVRSQVVFLDLVAKAVDDDLLGGRAHRDVGQGTSQGLGNASIFAEVITVDASRLSHYALC
jgi:hypothetical protein